MKRQPLRVGFDLDGVLLYNPTRLLRPFIVGVKKIFFKARKGVFFVPRHKLEKIIWYVFHKSSLFINPGFDDIKRLVREKKIKAYLITGRYSFLQADLDKWLKKLEADKYFEQCFFNKSDQQPTLFKEQIVRSLDLDYFIEDNWDIVAYLNSIFRKTKSKLKIFWVANFFDQTIAYPYKFPRLADALKQIDSELS